MILDEQCMFSNNQIITASCVSENVLDLGNREISFGTPVDVLIQVTETFNNLTSLSVKVQTSITEDFASSVDLIEQTVLLSDLKKGCIVPIQFLPKGNLGYMRLYYTVTGEAPTKGGITAAVTDGTQTSFHNM